VDEAEVEHAAAKDLITQIRNSSPALDTQFNAKVNVLGEYVEQHVREEEGAIFPQVRRAKIDTQALGEQIAARKAEILGEVADGSARASSLRLI